MILTFTFSIDQQTSEAVFAGNIVPQIALQLLQNIVIQTAIKQLQDEAKAKEQEVKKVEDVLIQKAPPEES